MVTDTIEETLKHALFLARHIHKGDLQCAATAVLLELRVPANRIGFDYLKNAIVLFYDDPAQMITKGLYPAVGELYEAKPGSVQVEQAIRAVIKDAWKNRNEKVWVYYFSSVIDKNGNLKKPSNSEFIAGIGRFLELWQGCCEEANYEYR